MSDKSKNKPYIMMFTGSNCKPCEEIKPEYFELAKQTEKVSFKMPYDVGKLSPDQMIEKFGFKVKSLPAFAGYADGECLARFVGADSNQLKQLVNLMKSEAKANLKIRVNG